MKTVEENWQEFKQKVIPPDAPEIQFTEMRLAYYSGVIDVLALLDRRLPQDELKEALMEWFKNCTDFVTEYTEST